MQEGGAQLTGLLARYVRGKHEERKGFLGQFLLILVVIGPVIILQRDSERRTRLSRGGTAAVAEDNAQGGAETGPTRSMTWNTTLSEYLDFPSSATAYIKAAGRRQPSEQARAEQAGADLRPQGRTVRDGCREQQGNWGGRAGVRTHAPWRSLRRFPSACRKTPSLSAWATPPPAPPRPAPPPCTHDCRSPPCWCPHDATRGAPPPAPPLPSTLPSRAATRSRAPAARTLRPPSPLAGWLPWLARQVAGWLAV